MCWVNMAFAYIRINPTLIPNIFNVLFNIILNFYTICQLFLVFMHPGFLQHFEAKSCHHRYLSRSDCKNKAGIFERNKGNI